MRAMGQVLALRFLVERAIRPILELLPVLPPSLVRNRIELASAVNEVFVRACLGGSFYVGVGAGVMFIRNLKKRHSFTEG